MVGCVVAVVAKDLVRAGEAALSHELPGLGPILSALLVPAAVLVVDGEKFNSPFAAGLAVRPPIGSRGFSACGTDSVMPTHASVLMSS